jgi:hypothetical protein
MSKSAKSVPKGLEIFVARVMGGRKRTVPTRDRAQPEISTTTAVPMMTPRTAGNIHGRYDAGAECQGDVLPVANAVTIHTF